QPVGNQRGEEGEQDDHRDGGGGDDGRPVRAQPLPGQLPRAAALDNLAADWSRLGGGLERGLGNHAHDLPPSPDTGSASAVSTPSGSMTRSFAPIVGLKSARFSPWAIGRWQAAVCPGPSPSRGSSFGSCVTQTGAAFGQRGWKRQPEGGAMGEGTSPTSTIC